VLYVSTLCALITAGAFSELLYWQRIYDAAFKSYGLYGDHKKRNLQVNSVSADEAVVTSMKEFCPEKGDFFKIECSHYRAATS
jgi:hypothetical protein